jgi:hypothetical protein
MTLYSHNGKYPQPLPETITYETTENPQDHPNVSNEIWQSEEWITVEVNSSELSDDQLLDLGYVRVEGSIPDFDPDLQYVEWDGQQYNVLYNIKGQTPQPEYDPVWQICVWGETEWKLVPTKKAIHREVKWVRIRNRRNFLLTTTDDLIRQFMENNESISEEWASYRNALRDIPNTYETGDIDDADTVVWPVAPSQFNQTLYEDLLSTINDTSASEDLRTNPQIKYDLLIAVKWRQLKNYENGVEDSALNEYINTLESLSYEDLDCNVDDVDWPLKLQNFR